MDSTESKRYNGWANYDTWNVMLWLDNDEGLYRDYQRALRSGRIHDADSAEAYIRGVFPEGTPDIQVSGLNGYDPFSDVDWEEIYEHMVAD